MAASGQPNTLNGSSPPTPDLMEGREPLEYIATKVCTDAHPKQHVDMHALAPKEHGTSTSHTGSASISNAQARIAHTATITANADATAAATQTSSRPQGQVPAHAGHACTRVHPHPHPHSALAGQLLSAAVAAEDE